MNLLGLVETCLYFSEVFGTPYKSVFKLFLPVTIVHDSFLVKNVLICSGCRKKRHSSQRIHCSKLAYYSENPLLRKTVQQATSSKRVYVKGLWLIVMWSIVISPSLLASRMDSSSSRSFNYEVNIFSHTTLNSTHLVCSLSKAPLLHCQQAMKH